MEVLLDTQSFIWFFEDNPRLPASIRLYMEKSSSLVISIASFWEITIKTNLGGEVIPRTLTGTKTVFTKIEFSQTDRHF